MLTCKQGLGIHEPRGELECEMIVNVEDERQKMRHTMKLQGGLYGPPEWRMIGRERKQSLGDKQDG
jgi:hypothetical protein